MAKTSPFVVSVVVVAGILCGWVAHASVPSAPAGSESASDGESKKPLEVNGQSRNLNMMLVLRNDKDKIKFVKIRENYHDEIMSEYGGKSPVQNQAESKEGN